MEYHVVAEGVDVAAFERATLKAIALAAAAGVPVVLAVPTLGTATRHGALVGLFTQASVDALYKKRTATINGVTFYLEAGGKRTSTVNAVMLALNLLVPTVMEIVADYRTTDLVYVPWAALELTDYLTHFPHSVAI